MKKLSFLVITLASNAPFIVGMHRNCQLEFENCQIAVKAEIQSKKDQQLKQLLYSDTITQEKLLTEFQRLLELGANVDALGIFGRTALSVAAKRGFLDVAKVAMAAGADINLQGTPGGETPLMGATRGHIEIVKTLIEAGVDVNRVTSDGMGPLRYAVEFSNPEIVALLIKAGAQIDAQDRYRNTPLVIAAGAAGTALEQAARISIVKMLIKAGANVNAVGDKGTTALMRAIGSHSIEKVEALMAAGADINIPDNNGETALIVAGRSFNLPIMIALIDPVLKPEIIKQIRLLLMIHNRPESTLSAMPKEILKIIIFHAYPQYVKKLGMDLKLLAGTDMKILVDTIPLKLLAEAIRMGALDRGAVLKAWNQRIANIIDSLRASKARNKDFAIKKIEQEVPAQIESILK